jgi:tetratricopeptide (TPR) repeat protein
MKKILLIVLLVGIMLECSGSEKLMKMYQTYAKDNNSANLNNLYEAINADLKINPKDEDAHLISAIIHLNLLSKELDFFESNLDSLTIRSKFQYANMLLSFNEFDDALAVYEKINEEAPKWSCPWRHKGEAYYKMKNYTNAEEAFLKAIETRKDHFDAYIWLTNAQFELKKYETALKTLETGLKYSHVESDDPEEEIADEDLEFLKLKLYKANKMKKEYKKLKKTLKKEYPESSEWEKIEMI